MKIQDLYDNYPNLTNEQVARQVLADLGVGGEAADLLFVPVHDHVIQCRRNLVRPVEAAAFAPVDTRMPSSRPTTTAARRQLMVERVWIPKAGYIPWGEVTVEQHEERIRFYEERIATEQKSRDRHIEAVRLITEAGVTCLNEVEGWGGKSAAA